MVDVKVGAFSCAQPPGRASNGSLLRAESELRWIQRRAYCRHSEVGEWNGATWNSLLWLKLHSTPLLHLYKEQMPEVSRLAAKEKLLHTDLLLSPPIPDSPTSHCPLTAGRSQSQTNAPTPMESGLFRLKPADFYVYTIDQIILLTCPKCHFQVAVYLLLTWSYHLGCKNRRQDFLDSLEGTILVNLRFLLRSSPEEVS